MDFGVFAQDDSPSGSNFSAEKYATPKPRRFASDSCYNPAMKTIVVANWKMNPATMREAKRLFEVTRRAAERARHTAVIVAPPTIFLRELSHGYRASKIAFAAQNAHFESAGAYTGELSLLQVRDARARYVLVGHAERRAMGESDDDICKKVSAAIATRITPILCVGEESRSGGGEHFDIVREQLRAGLADVAASNLSRILLVYEPLWTIGVKTTMSPREMHQMAIFLRKCVVDSHGEGGRTLKILYGGSVDEKNAAAMLREGDVRGFLVGRASINAVEFAELLQAVDQT